MQLHILPSWTQPVFQGWRKPDEANTQNEKLCTVVFLMRSYEDSMVNHFITFWLSHHWAVFYVYFWITWISQLARVWFIKLQKFSSQCLHCPSIFWQNYPWLSLIVGSSENGHPIRAFIVSNIHSCLRFLEAFSLCCVVLAWESHWSWPTWPVNLAHPLSVPLSDFCSPGFWNKI